MRATFEFFESDRDVVKLLFRDSFVLGDRFDRHLAGIYEGFIADIEKTIAAAQAAGTGHRRAASDDRLLGRRAHRPAGVAPARPPTTALPAEVVADFVVTLLLDGLRPRRKGR